MIHTRCMSRVVLLSAALGVLPIDALGQSWEERAKLLAEDGTADDWFGESVAIAQNHAFVGASYRNSNGANSGAVYSFDVVSGDQTGILLPDDSAQGDRFGYAVATNGSMVAVGAPYNDGYGHDSGAVYLFDAVSGVQLTKLSPLDPFPDGLFGYAVAINESVVAVGARQADNGCGRAYIFDLSTGSQLLKLTASDRSADDLFGSSVALNQHIAVIGAYGADSRGDMSGTVYIFDLTTGTQRARLVPYDGVARDYFGFSVAANDQFVLVGAQGDDDRGAQSGSVYVYSALDDSYLRKLRADDGAVSSYFGVSVAVTPDYSVIGARADSGYIGAAYVFDVATGKQLQKITASDGFLGDMFGWSVDAWGDMVVAGSPHDGENGIDSGSAYVYKGDGSRLPPPLPFPPPAPGKETQLWSIDEYNNDNGAPVDTIGDLDWTNTVVLIHGWRDHADLISDEYSPWIKRFRETALEDTDNGALYGRADIQTGVINWGPRADQDKFLPGWHSAWITGRNGFADGQVVGKQLADLSPEEVDPTRIHLVAHSNGSAFAAGLASSYEFWTSQSIKQLTVLDAPSNVPRPWNVPTGYLVQTHLGAVNRLESWTSGTSSKDWLVFGDLFSGPNVTNLLVSGIVSRIRTGLWRQSDGKVTWLIPMHSGVIVKSCVSSMHE